MKKIYHRLILVFGSTITIILISLSILSYIGIKKNLLKDIKERQLTTFLSSYQSDLQALINTSFETTQLLSKNSVVKKWIIDQENNSELGYFVRSSLKDMKLQNENYFVVQIVNNINLHTYIQKKDKLIDTYLSKDDPDDSWYFDFKNSDDDHIINFDFSGDIGKTLIFIDTKIFNDGQFLGIAAIGIDPLLEIEKLQDSKFTENSHIWLVHNDGSVRMSQDKKFLGTKIQDAIGATTLEGIVKNKSAGVIEDIIYDNKDCYLTYMPLKNSDYWIIMSSPKEELSQITSSFLNSILLLSLVFFILSLAIIFITSKNISKPLITLSEYSQNLQQGNLKVKVPDKMLNRQDEIGTLAKSFDLIIKKMTKIIHSIHDSVNQIDFDSKQISDNSQQLSMNSSMQASDLEEISTTLNQISEDVEQNSSKAEDTLTLSKQYNDKINELSVMSDNSVNANLSITEKIGVLNDIVSKTNILSLNASIEAAHAGHFGKGFAVVASEVRKLAKLGQDSATEIISLVEKAHKFSESTGTIINETTSQINKSSVFISEITTTNISQNERIKLVNNSIRNLNEITQNNAISGEALAAKAKELEQQAKLLNQLVKYFKV